MFASTVGGGAMTLVFRPAKQGIKGTVTSVKVPVIPAAKAEKKKIKL
jgi:hypothetical protein